MVPGRQRPSQHGVGGLDLAGPHMGPSAEAAGCQICRQVDDRVSSMYTYRFQYSAPLVLPFKASALSFPTSVFGLLLSCLRRPHRAGDRDTTVTRNDNTSRVR